MLFSVLLWMFYPPIINALMVKFDIFYLAAVIHSVAAGAMVLVLIFKFKKYFKYIFNKDTFMIMFFSTLASGILICLNHLLLYYALSLTTELDVVAILFFETWPLIFLYMDSVFRRKKGLTSNEIIFSITAFIGFSMLTLEHFNFFNLSFKIDFINVIIFSLLGGIAMAINTFSRINCVDKWSKISEKNSLKLSSLDISLITEVFARIIAAPLFIIVFLFSNESAVSFEMIDITLILFVGVFILSLGSVLYDLATYLSSSAAIGALWYIMPVGSILILSAYEMKFLTMNEGLSIFILILSNILIALNTKLSKTKIFIFVLFCFVAFGSTILSKL